MGTEREIKLPLPPTAWRKVQDADGVEVRVYRTFQIRDFARAAVLADRAAQAAAEDSGLLETAYRSGINDATARLALQAGEDAARLQAEIDRLNAIINTPHADDFIQAVSIEAEHQRQRWGSEGDAGKTPADWFWLVGYLAGKALHSHAAGNAEKAEHHVITTAAACANWHRAVFGRTNMRPGHKEGIGGVQPEVTAIDAARAAQSKGGGNVE